MGLVLSDNGGGSFEKAPEGVHAAVCYMVVDLGIQETKEFGTKRQILIGWELLDETRQDGHPVEIEKTFNASLNEKSALRKFLQDWRGRQFTKEELEGFDLKNVLGKNCMLNIVHATARNNKVYANIQSVTPLPKAVPVRAGKNASIYYDTDAPDPEEYAKIREYWQKKINHNSSPQLVADKPAMEEFAEVPF